MPEVPSTCFEKFVPKYRGLQLHHCGTNTKPTSIMPTSDSPSGAMSRVIKSQTQLG